MALFNLPVLQATPVPSPAPAKPAAPAPAQPAPTPAPLPPQPQIGKTIVPGQPVPFTDTGTPAGYVTFTSNEPVGFFTDTTVCIGCKACEVACKEWNQLPAEMRKDGQALPMTGNSYDNTGELSGTSYRHVKFIEQFDTTNPNRVGGKWLMMSDVCKHCVQAGCLEVCPTGAIMRTEFDTVFIQEDICNGCRYCITACPFGVIGINETTHTASKCTFCYDRLQVGLTPACAQACPTASIKFGPLSELQRNADTRLATLQSMGNSRAYLYGRDDAILGGLNAFYLLEDKATVYGLPEVPKLPSRDVASSGLIGVGAAVMAGLASMLAFRKHRMDSPADEAHARGGS